MTTARHIAAIAAAVVLTTGRPTAGADGRVAIGDVQGGAGPVGAPADRLIGLLVLPDVIGPPCGRVGAARQPVYDRPRRLPAPKGLLWFQVTPRPGDTACDDATLLFEAATGPAARMPTEEIGYEEQALIVFENRAPWYRVKGPGGSLWVERSSLADFTAYEHLLSDGLAFIEDDWDMGLWPSPDAPQPISVGQRWRRPGDSYPVDVLAHRLVSGVLWFQVRLRRESCGEVIADPPEVEGWIHAYRPDGRPAVWFHSRGC